MRPNKEDFKRAEQLGIEARLADKKCIPFHDAELRKILRACEEGETYKISHAWLDAWTRCNVQLGCGIKPQTEEAQRLVNEFESRCFNSRTCEPYQNGDLLVVVGQPPSAPDEEKWPIALVINDRTKEARIDELGQRLYAECVKFSCQKIESQKGDPSKEDVTLHYSEGYYNIIV